MKQPIDMRPDHAKIVHEIIVCYLPAGVSVRVFGSRAKWTAKPHSDLDLALKGNGVLPHSVLGNLAEAFSESDLPFRVDVVDWHAVSPSFQAVVDRDGVPLTVQLGQVATLLSGGTPSKSNKAFWDGDIPWLTPKDMGQWEGGTDAHVTKAALGNGTRLAPQNASFIAVRGMSLHNEIRVVRSARPLTFNQDIKAIVAGPSIDSNFLYYALTASKPILLGLVSAAGHGTGVLDTDRLRSLEIPALPIDEQRTIASVLGALDDKIELTRRMNETLEATARAIFKDWFVDFGPTRAKMEGRAPYLAADVWSLFPDRLDDEGKPEGWSVKPLDQVADFLNGIALQKHPSNGIASLPVIKIAQLRAASVSSADRASTQIPKDYVVENGDVLFSWSGSLLHRVWTGGRGALNQHLFKVTSKQFPKWFFFYWIAEHMPSFQATAASKATTMGHIQRHHLTQAITFVGTPDVMKAADEIMGPLLNRQIANDLESRTLAATRDFFLPKLMSGEVRVKDAVKFVGEAA